MHIFPWKKKEKKEKKEHIFKLAKNMLISIRYNNHYQRSVTLQSISENCTLECSLQELYVKTEVVSSIHR